MTTPKTLAKLLESAEARVRYLEEKYTRAQRNAQRTGSMFDLSAVTIAEAQLERAKSHFNGLKMQVKYEGRFQLSTDIDTSNLEE